MSQNLWSVLYSLSKIDVNDVNNVWDDNHDFIVIHDDIDDVIVIGGDTTVEEDCSQHRQTSWHSKLQFHHSHSGKQLINH